MTGQFELLGVSLYDGFECLQPESVGSFVSISGGMTPIPYPQSTFSRVFALLLEYDEKLPLKSVEPHSKLQGSQDMQGTRAMRRCTYKLWPLSMWVHC